MTLRRALTQTAVALVLTASAPPESPAPPKSDGAKVKPGLSDGVPPAETADAALSAHNRERSEAKLAPLSLDPKLTAAAQVQAADMAAHAKMTHEGTDKSTPAERIKRQGFEFLTAGENVAEGQRSVEAVMKAWMDSPHHRDNILGKFTRLGFAVARGEDGTPFWCADFAANWPRHEPARAAADVVEALNKVRKTADLAPLAARPGLTEAAAAVAHALARADSMDFAKVPGSDLAAALKKSGYTFKTVAEGVAVGTPDAAGTVKMWADSPPHRANVLGDFTEVGVGYANAPSGKPYWCLILAKPRAD